MAETSTAVRFTAVHKSFGAVRAVAGIDPEIARGETTALGRRQLVGGVPGWFGRLGGWYTP
jgi:ABC-2 type transport system ATP-binding protein